MGNIVKFLLGTVVFAVTVAVIAVVYVVMVFDPNDYKPEIEAMAAKQDVELTIHGNLAWQFLPKPGISVGNINFSTQRRNLGPDIDKLSGQIGQATLVTDWRSLLDTQAAASNPLGLLNTINLSNSQALITPSNGLPIQLDDINLRVGRVSLQNKPFPVSVSFTALGGIPASASFVASIDSKAAEIIGLSLSIDELDIAGALTTDLDSLNTRGNLQVSSFNLKRQLATLQKRFPLFKVPKMASKTALSEFSIDSVFDINLADISQYSHQVVLDGQSFDVNVKIEQSRNKLTLSIRGDTFKLADYIAIPDNLASKDSAAIFAPLALPFMLWHGQSQMEVAVGTIQLDDFAVTNFYSNIFGNQRVLRVTALNGDMFGGQANMIAKFDMRSKTPSFNIQPSLSNINLGSALPALTDTSDLTGRLNLQGNIQGAGNNRKTILTSLTGAGQFEITAPSYADTNIEETFCNAAALFGSGNTTNQVWPKGTQLDNLGGNFQFNNGKLLVSDYTTGTGNLTLGGNATVDMLGKKYNLKANALLNSTTTSVNGCSVNSRLQNRTIPFICKGRFGQSDSSKAKPAFCKPDERVLKELLKNTALEKLGDQLFNSADEEQNPLENLFKELLKKNLN